MARLIPCTGKRSRSRGRRVNAARPASTVRHRAVLGTDRAPLDSVSHRICRRVRQNESTLQRYSPQVASRKAPADAENTEKLSGASIPSAKVIETANKSSSNPLRKATTRMYAPRMRPKPNKISAQVDAQARTGIARDGINQFSLAVYAVKCAKSPQATFLCPNVPQKPNRSATAERNEIPRANRKNIEAKSSSRFNKSSTSWSGAISSPVRYRWCTARGHLRNFLVLLLSVFVLFDRVR